VGQTGPLPRNQWLPSGVPVTPAVVIAAVIGMPIAPPIIVAVRVMSRSNSDKYAETVSVMLAFAISGLRCIRAYQGKSCADKKCSQSKFLEHKLTS
jgi:hypothetical protein